MSDTNRRSAPGLAHHGLGATPPAEVLIDETLVRSLLVAQHPDLAHLPLHAAGEGWDNAVFRLGDELAVRLPRRAIAADLIAHEQRWLPGLSRQLPLPIPAPRRVGRPASGYPWLWSVVPWFEGVAAAQNPPGSSQASVFGRFLRSLHKPAPPDAPHNPFRSVPLRAKAESMLQRMDRLAPRTDLITTELRQVWTKAVETPLDQPSTWIHGDLHPRNVLVDKNTITGIIDWGDLCSGDPATDLASVWMLFPDERARSQVWQSYGAPSESLLLRAHGWRIVFGVSLLETGLTNHPENAVLGGQILTGLKQKGPETEVSGP